MVDYKQYPFKAAKPFSYHGRVEGPELRWPTVLPCVPLECVGNITTWHGGCLKVATENHSYSHTTEDDGFGEGFRIDKKVNLFSHNQVILDN